MRKILEKLFPLNVIWRLMAVVALAALTLFVSELLFGTTGPGGAYRVVVIVLTILSYLLILPSFALVVMGRAKSHLLQGSVVMALVFIICRHVHSRSNTRHGGGALFRVFWIY